MSSSAAPLTIPRLLADAAAKHRENLAVVDGDLRVSYRELADMVFRTARAYIASGVRPGDRVAVWAPNRIEFMLAMLGAQSAGACVVPINTRYRGQEAAVILGRSRASVLVFAGGFLGKDFSAMLRDAVAPEARPGETGPVPGLPALKTLVDITAERSAAHTLAWPDFLSRADQISPEQGAETAEAVAPEDVCDIMFTSGTTGVPKGVMSAHRQTIGVARVWATGAELSPADNYAIVNPFFHGFGYKAGMIAALEAGSTIYPLPTFDVDQVLSLISAAGISVLPGAPTIFTSLLDHPRLAEFDLGSLRFAIAGAATVPESLFQRMRDELGFETVAQAYGLTECVVATQSRPNEDPAHVAETTGPAVPGIEIRVVDAEQKSVPVGQDGEIVLRGDNVMLGYFEDEDATRAAIDSEGWFHTGDVGRLDEHGCLKITDRIKDMFIVGGFNVYPAEVENTLGAHPDVSESAVVGIPDARLGTVACAYVVPRRDARPTPEDIIAFCRTRLANFKVPNKVVLIDELPKNASGKIMKTDLRGGTPTG
ncbi:AMP-binding protein [Streptomyces sp. NPDC058067]|uniref:AMP-binding protein n=1 Tax=Streptomyces sp. NPDC058067 TaxID=3346324 RepID=UPI0036E04891